MARGVLPVDVVEGRVVGGLAAEGLHRADAVHGLGEVDDHRGDRRARAPVDPAAAAPEHPHQQVHRQEGGQREQAEPPVHHQQHDRDVEDRQDDREQLLQALVEQLAQGVHVAGGAGDDPARGVALVEVQAEQLGVPEDPAAQLEQDVLVEQAGDPDERALQQRAERPRSRGRRR